MATAFFTTLGLVVEGEMDMAGEFMDTVIGIPGSPAAMSTELGLRNVAFEVNDLQGALDTLAGDGYGLVGGVGSYENAWLMAYVRGPEGIIVALAERIG